MKKFFSRIGKFFKDLKAEIKKVIWPSKKQLINNTGVVIIVILLVGIGIWILDLLFSRGYMALMQ
ncbi:MAG: preprotein translocase subunit SecE [Ruminococcaceae bacterium]|nr:preprotein translocase subunit SecE [Oscillospiraceae bacterium]